MTLTTHLNWGIDGLDYTSDISELTYQLNGYDNCKDLFRNKCKTRVKVTYLNTMTINYKRRN